MQTMKHTEGLFRVDEAAANDHVSVWAAPTKASGGYQRWVADCEVALPNEISHKEAVGNAHLLGAAPWYRLLALIAADPIGDSNVERVTHHRPNRIDVRGWSLSVKQKSWVWDGDQDAFGVPVPPPQKMFNEIKQALESL